MCEYFVNADPIQYEQRTRTLRIRGLLTSIRLENMVWDVLAEMAGHEGFTTNMLISKFHDEIRLKRGEVPNFASFLRVTCIRYLLRHAAEAGGHFGKTEDTEQPRTPTLSFIGADTGLTVVAARNSHRAA